MVRSSYAQTAVKGNKVLIKESVSARRYSPRSKLKLLQILS